MQHNLTGRITFNAALLIDAAACFAGASVLLLLTTVWNWIDLPSSWRMSVIAMLFLFSILLVIAARYQHRVLVALSALGNIAWIIGGAIALFFTGSISGVIIITLVILADAIMAWLQAKRIPPTAA